MLIQNRISWGKCYISIADECCGAGATLIAAINTIKRKMEKATPSMNFQRYLLVVGQDIDETVALMCYIQISLLGVAGYIRVGNSIIDPMITDDDKSKYWYTPMYFSDIWAIRRFNKKERMTSYEKKILNFSKKV